MNENILQIEHVSKAFGKKVVLKDVTLNIKRGEFVTLLGPSGCGKTTLLRMIAGFEPTTTGQILLEGKDITSIPPYQRPMNTVFQKYALFPHLSVYDNIAFGLKLKGLSEDETDQKVLAALKMVSMTDYEERDVNSLSGGQQQRVAIARAIVNEPQVLLLDEPLSALDAKMRKDMQMELREMHQRLGITFIFVTHDQQEALTLSDTVIVLDDGVVQQIGTPRDIYNEPANPFVADFIGESNIFDGTMTEANKVTFMGKEFNCVDPIPPMPYGVPQDAPTPVDVVIRPEDISIVDEAKGQWTGKLRSCVFQGVHYEMFFDTPDGYEIQVQDYNAYEVGTSYGLTVPPQELHVMAVESICNSIDATVVDSDHIDMLGARFLCQKHGFLQGEEVYANFSYKVELTDNPADGMATGTIINILYKGDHYRLTVRTENRQKIYVDTTDVWEDFDRVGIKILPEQITIVND